VILALGCVMLEGEIPDWFISLKNIIGFAEISILYWLLATMLFDQLKRPYKRSNEK
jgi:hypothetical protein